MFNRHPLNYGQTVCHRNGNIFCSIHRCPITGKYWFLKCENKVEIVNQFVPAKVVKEEMKANVYA
jgi:hypothetical protein